MLHTGASRTSGNYCTFLRAFRRDSVYLLILIVVICYFSLWRTTYTHIDVERTISIPSQNSHSIQSHQRGHHVLRSTCDYTDTENWNVAVQPKYSTRRNKYISAVVSRGPNNQLISIRETLYLAITLNRSFIMPPMFKHGLGDPTANGEIDIIPAYLRINVHRVRELINILPPGDAHQSCPDIGFDAFYRVVKPFCKSEGLRRIGNTCEFLNLTCISDDGTFIAGKKRCSEMPIPMVPSRERIFTEFGMPVDSEINPLQMFRPRAKLYQFDANLTRANAYYSTEHICPVVVYPYQAVDFWYHIAEYSSGNISPANTLIKDIILHTPRPKFVEKYVDEFLSDLGEHFIAIHWRYDAADWFSEQCNNNLPGKSFICQNPDIIRNATELAPFVTNYVVKLQENNKYDFMYIASPPAQQDLLKNVRNLVANDIPDFKIYLQSELLQFLNSSLTKSDCDNTSDYIYDTLSLSEMEICFRSKIFLRSIASSWSLNINMERQIAERHQNDTENTHLFIAN